MYHLVVTIIIKEFEYHAFKNQQNIYEVLIHAFAIMVLPKRENVVVLYGIFKARATKAHKYSQYNGENLKENLNKQSLKLSYDTHFRIK